MTSSPRTRRVAAWLPEQHGAWAMLLLPFAAGVWLADPAWVHLPLLALWLTGYAAYSAASTWLRARRRARHRRPVLGLGVVAACFGIATALLAPALAWWVLPYAPLLGGSLWLAARGRERSVHNDALAVTAAALMAAVAFDAGGGGEWAALWTVAAVQLAYFLGTILYVKTMIRERGRPGYVAASVGYHVGATIAVGVLALAGTLSVSLVVVWAALLARAAAGPAANARRARPLRPAVVGVGEIAASLVLTGAALAAVAPTS